jgi:hypothetical protein
VHLLDSILTNIFPPEKLGYARTGRISRDLNELTNEPSFSPRLPNSEWASLYTYRCFVHGKVGRGEQCSQFPLVDPLGFSVWQSIIRTTLSEIRSVLLYSPILFSSSSSFDFPSAPPFYIVRYTLRQFMMQFSTVFTALSLPVAMASPHFQHKNNNCTIGQIVDTSSGPVAGHAATDYPEVSEYLGIPYGQAPVGDLRFAAPMKYTASSMLHGSVYVS